MSGFLEFQNFSNFYSGLNIEGCRPSKQLPLNCTWYNIIQVIDEPLNGITFDKVMGKVENNNFSYIEQTIPNIDLHSFLSHLIHLIQQLKSNNK